MSPHPGSLRLFSADPGHDVGIKGLDCGYFKVPRRIEVVECNSTEGHPSEVPPGASFWPRFQVTSRIYSLRFSSCLRFPITVTPDFTWYTSKGVHGKPGQNSCACGMYNVSCAFAIPG